MSNNEEACGVENISKVTKRRKVNLALRVNETVVADSSVQPVNKMHVAQWAVQNHQ